MAGRSVQRFGKGLTIHHGPHFAKHHTLRSACDDTLNRLLRRSRFYVKLSSRISANSECRTHRNSPRGYSRGVTRQRRTQLFTVNIDIDKEGSHYVIFGWSSLAVRVGSTSLGFRVSEISFPKENIGAATGARL